MPTHAVFNTTAGTITCRLFDADAPRTVANFVALAEGTRRWTSPARRSARLYDGTPFHRVVPDFFIQGGDPEGTGAGGPGYVFADEIAGSPHTFDNPGMLAMANRGIDTNGSQFFLTGGPADWLNRHHTIFGEVLEGLEIVRAISRQPWGSLAQPSHPVLLQSVTIQHLAESLCFHPISVPVKAAA
jgi:peptidyl-prolyl cis-trans isomerase A (cyclophilin A)